MPVNIRGKSYITVAERVRDFRSAHPMGDGWGINTDAVSITPEVVVVRAQISDPQGRIVGSGYAEEVRASSNINRTSALENAETSAIGRALASVGFGGDEYASANEVEQAIAQQEAPPQQQATPDAGNLYLNREQVVGKVVDGLAKKYRELILKWMGDEKPTAKQVKMNLAALVKSRLDEVAPGQGDVPADVVAEVGGAAVKSMQDYLERQEQAQAQPQGAQGATFTEDPCPF